LFSGVLKLSHTMACEFSVKNVTVEGEEKHAIPPGQYRQIFMYDDGKFELTEREQDGGKVAIVRCENNRITMEHFHDDDGVMQLLEPDEALKEGMRIRLGHPVHGPIVNIVAVSESAIELQQDGMQPFKFESGLVFGKNSRHYTPVPDCPLRFDVTCTALNSGMVSKDHGVICRRGSAWYRSFHPANKSYSFDANFLILRDAHRKRQLNRDVGSVTTNVYLQMHNSTPMIFQICAHLFRSLTPVSQLAPQLPDSENMLPTDQADNERHAKRQNPDSEETLPTKKVYDGYRLSTPGD